MFHFMYAFFLLLASFQMLGAHRSLREYPANDPCLLLTKIDLADFPNAYNPSIIKTNGGFLLVFRHLPDPKCLWLSNIGVVLLNESLQPISIPQLLNTRAEGAATRSQSEDARIFSYNNELYLIYNDCTEQERASRRDMFIAKLNESQNQFVLDTPLRLYHKDNWSSQRTEKNWSPFEWKNTLLLTYSIAPHEVLFPNLKKGMCEVLFQSPTPVKWKWGPLRGGTPALLVDSEYLAFFHSFIETSSISSKGEPMPHYYMGAYTFSPDPPFEITKITPQPIVIEGFYTQSNDSKRVIYPGGFLVSGPDIYLAYGKDDHEIWIAKIEKEWLMGQLQSVIRD